MSTFNYHTHITWQVGHEDDMKQLYPISRVKINDGLASGVTDGEYTKVDGTYIRNWATREAAQAYIEHMTQNSAGVANVALISATIVGP